jgi:alkanesulfonate monooxygenase SsuD/methylene tetrahydromethanopterin reductase-like flavin-dependent oxidoreductase (luciferase family)
MTRRATPSPEGGNSWDPVLTQARLAGSLGVDEIWLGGRLTWAQGTAHPKGSPVGECYIGLAGLAVGTRTVKLAGL